MTNGSEDSIVIADVCVGYDYRQYIRLVLRSIYSSPMSSVEDMTHSSTIRRVDDEWKTPLTFVSAKTTSTLRLEYSTIRIADVFVGYPYCTTTVPFLSVCTTVVR